MIQVLTRCLKLFLLLIQVNMDSEGVESTANVTDIHEPLHFDITEEHDSGYRCVIAQPLLPVHICCLLCRTRCCGR